MTRLPTRSVLRNNLFLSFGWTNTDYDSALVPALMMPSTLAAPIMARGIHTGRSNPVAVGLMASLQVAYCHHN